MLKALLPAIMELFAYLLVLHLGIDNMLLPPRREYSVSRLEGTRECNLCDSSVRIRWGDQFILHKASKTNFRLEERVSLTIRVLRESIHCFSGFINTELWSEKPTGGRISGTL